MLLYKARSSHCEQLSSEMWTLGRDSTLWATPALLNVEWGPNTNSVFFCLYMQYSYQFFQFTCLNGSLHIDGEYSDKWIYFSPLTQFWNIISFFPVYSVCDHTFGHTKTQIYLLVSSLDASIQLPSNILFFPLFNILILISSLYQSCFNPYCNSNVK